MNVKDASSENSEILSRIAVAVEVLAKNSQPAEKEHPLSDMSNEEIALVLLKRGKIKTKRQCAQVLGLNESTVHRWQYFGAAFDAFKRGEKLGRITKGFNDGNGDIDGYS